MEEEDDDDDGKPWSKMRSALFWVVRQRVVVIPYPHFGTSYRYVGWLQKNTPLKLIKAEARTLSEKHNMWLFLKFC